MVLVSSIFRRTKSLVFPITKPQNIADGSQSSPLSLIILLLHKNKDKNNLWGSVVLFYHIAPPTQWT